MSDAGASPLVAALGRGALPRVKRLKLVRVAIGDAGLVALAPALRRLPALQELYLGVNLFGDEGLAALVAPPPPAGALSLPTAGLTKLKVLSILSTQVTDAGSVPLSPLRSTTARCRRSSRSVCTLSLQALLRWPPCLRFGPPFVSIHRKRIR